MKRFFSLSRLLALAILPTLALAVGTTATLSWIAPTQYTDGSPVAAGDLDHYTITWAPASGQSGPSGSLTAPGSALTATVPVACGQVSFAITVTSSATARYPNATSGPTNPLSYVTGVKCTPNPPTGATVN